MNNIRALRTKKGIKSQQEFAQQIGVTQPTVSDWESGKKTPIGINLRKLADFFEVDEKVIEGKVPIDNSSIISKQSTFANAKTFVDIYSADYERAAIKAAETIIKHHITAASIDPLQILKSTQNVIVVSFTEMADGSGFDRDSLVTLFGAENQDAITFAKDVEGIRYYIVAYNQSMPFYITQRALARELGHIVLGHNETHPDDICTAEALYFSRYLLCPRPMIKAIQETGMQLTVKVFGNITGCYGRFLAGVRKTPGAHVPAELNNIIKLQFAQYVTNLYNIKSLITSDDDSTLADFGTYMDNYEE